MADSRPGEVELIANMFKVQIPKTTMYQYGVDFANPTMETLVLRKRGNRYFKTFVEQYAKDEISFFVYDGMHTLYLPKPLADPQKKATLNLGRSKRGDRDITQDIILNYAGPINISADEFNEDVQRALVLYLRQLFINTGEWIARTRGMFKKGEESKIANSLIAVHQGFDHVFVRTLGGVFLNSELKYDVRSESTPLLTFMCMRAMSINSRMAGCNLGDADSVKKAFDELWTKDRRLVKAIFNELRNHPIMLAHVKGPKSHKIVDHVSMHETPATVRFQLQRKDATGNVVTKETNVADYFSERYKVAVEHATEWPVVVMKKGRGRDGQEATEEKYPMEVIVIPGGAPTLSSKERQAVSEKTITQPTQRFGAIESHLASVKAALKAGPLEITIDDTLVRFKGRVLPHPTLGFGGGRTVPSQGGQWSFRDGGSRFPACVSKQDVIVLYPENVDRDSRRAISVMQDVADERGMKLTFTTERYDRDERGETLLRCMRKYAEKKPKPFVLVVVPFEETVRYNTVKTYCELEAGLSTQFIQSTNFCKANKSVFGNILLSINAKAQVDFSSNQLPGENVEVKDIPLNDGATAFIGLDVSHPRSLSGGPSEAAMSVLFGPRGNWLFGTHRTQESHTEEMKEIGAMMTEFLENMIRIRQNPFRRFVVIRDGLTNKEFMTVAEREVAAIRGAVDAIYQRNAVNCKPTITFLVAQKRHNFRMATSDGVLKIPAPGTVADKDVCQENNFYMISHISRLGTPKPTNYHVLVDENNLGKEQLEKMMYYLSYLYPGCTLSVSLPAPLYCAHQLSFRAQTVYRPGKMYGVETSSTSSGGSDFSDTITLQDSLKFTGFYL